MITENKQILNMTGAEFVELLRQGLGLISEEPDDAQEKTVEKHYVYGLAGLSNLLGCSTATAARIKKSGAIDAAISQKGRIIVVDADLALTLLSVRNQRGGNRRGYTLKTK